MTSAAWNALHNAYCLEQKFPASVRTLWQWLLEQAENSHCEIEFDLKDFNKWVEKKRGYPFDVKTLKYARDRLMNSKVVSHLNGNPNQLQAIWLGILSRAVTESRAAILGGPVRTLAFMPLPTISVREFKRKIS